MKRKIRLSESKLHRIIQESVKKVLREAFVKPDDYNKDNKTAERPSAYFAFIVDDRGELWLLSKTTDAKIQMIYFELQTNGDEHCWVEVYEDKWNYADRINYYKSQGYIIHPPYKFQ